MKLDVTAQVKLPGSVGKARLSEPFADIEFGGRRISFARPLDIEVTYVYDCLLYTSTMGLWRLSRRL